MMVLLTRAFIEKECVQTQSNKSLTRQITKNHLRKITHLHMNDKFIESIGNFSGCKNLRVIYMQNNEISTIENLDFCLNLTHLYLQHNNINKIENLNCLINLKCLFLGYNKISIVENLENLRNLSEFHIEYQNLTAGEILIFDPRSLHVLSSNVKILNLAGNNICSLKQLKHFKCLEHLDVSNNKIVDVENIAETIHTLTSLKFLSLRNNPVSLTLQYRERLISCSDSLEYLDGKSISNMSRLFLRNLRERQQKRLENPASELSLSDEITTSLNLPPAFKKSVSRAILQQQQKQQQQLESKLSIINSGPVSGEMHLQYQIFPPWKCTTTINGRKNDHIMPRPLWRTKARIPALGATLSERVPLPSINYNYNVTMK